MVKNIKGGKGHKSMGRKFQNQSTNNQLILSSDPLEKYAIVTKMYGNGMCEVWYLNDKNESIKVIGHIRNKMRGRQKRHNTVTSNAFVLVGLRDWESTPKNCDILNIYDTNQVEQLKQRPDINISGLTQFITNSNPSNTIEESGFEFDHNDNDNIDDNEINEQEFIVTYDGDKIDIDDI